MTDYLWSPPDADGIITCNLGVGAASTLRGRRKRKGTRFHINEIAMWPVTWRELLKEWLSQGGTKRKWTGLQKICGSHRIHEGWQLIDYMLKAGLVEVEELRDKGRWQPLWVEFLHMESTREIIGLPNRQKLQKAREANNDHIFQNNALNPLKDSFEAMPAERAVRRHSILVALDQWIIEERSGTRRDFSLFAEGDTKAISSAEWDWIESAICLENVGIYRHTPAVWLRAPLKLITSNGALDLQVVTDNIGLTPETIDRLISIEGQIECWRVLENRTVFERVARQRGAADGVLWVPGFAPSWWRNTVGKLLGLCPAPAMVACDPDPAGIEIALDVGQVWAGKNLFWEPWRMDSETLSCLKRKKKLSDDDYGRLKR